MTDNELRERLAEPLSDILEALELAGYAVVKRERWERVRGLAEYYESRSGWSLAASRPPDMPTLCSGDLDATE